MQDSKKTGQPRPEYPRPQFARKEWLNLNGEWQFMLDQGSSGEERGLFQAADFTDVITVPFCPESKLSGIAHTDFILSCWYKKTVDIPAEWLDGRLLLQFGAVYYEAKVWVNGSPVGTHRGGHTSFWFDIADYVKAGENEIVVWAKSDVRSGKQPAGKQSAIYESRGARYTRTTGIWQTVWLEPVPNAYINQVFLTPDIANGSVHIKAMIGGCGDATLTAAASFGGKPMGETVLSRNGATIEGSIALAESHLWNVGAPALYDLTLSLAGADGKTDNMTSYFGLRRVDIDGLNVLINGKPVYQRLVLDQGFYPDGIITAPSDNELKKDIERSVAMGFNGARLHQKIFEPRFLYWADQLGYIVWGEHGNWGLDISSGDGLLHFLPEWIESVQRDYSSPALVGWCPFNETQPTTQPLVLEATYRATKALDPTRPVIDTSGWVHCDVTDIFDYHDYEQDPAVFAENTKCYVGSKLGEPFKNRPGFPFTRGRRPIINRGQPVFVSEFGGIAWRMGGEADNAWGYGKSVATEEEFLTRLKGLMDVMLDTPGLCGFCYTQLTDVEQEINGLYTYDRRAKFDPAVIHGMICRQAHNERE